MAYKRKTPRKVVKTPEDLIIGDEPTKININKEFDLVKALNWYTYQHDSKQAAEFLNKWMKATKQYKDADIKSATSAVESGKVPPTVGFMARIATNHNMDPKLAERINSRLIKHKALAASLPSASGATAAAATTRLSPFKKVVNAANAVTSELDDAVIKMLSGESVEKVDLYNLITKKGLKGPHARVIAKWLDKLVGELKDGEGYQHYSKANIRNTLKHLEKMRDDANLVVGNAVKTRKPRKKVGKTVEKATSNVAFKERDDQLKIVSVPPAKIVGAQGVWLYDTKFKKITVLRAATGQQLGFKGKTTVTGFDPATSATKRYGKTDALTQITTGTKAAVIKVVDNIKSKKLEPSGRLGPNTLILKVI